MPRGRKPKYALAEDPDGRLVPTPIEALADPTTVPDAGFAAHQRALEAAQEFQWLLSRDDGWLRATGDSGGKLNYFKWKFSRGEYRGKYVMYVAPVGDWSAGILGLAEKVSEVDAGVRKPAYDTYGGASWED